jgi:sugar phosphate permease
MLKDVERSPVPRSSERPALSGIKSLFRLRNYVVIITGYTAHTFALGGFAAWAPHYSANALGSSLAEASFKIGAITCTAGVVGTLLGGKLSDSFARAHGEFDAMRYVKFCGIVTLIAAPFAAWLLTATTINHFMIAMLFVQIAMFASVAPINTATLAAAPQELSATAFAVQIFVIHALGDVISPPLVGWLSDRMPMNVAMSVLVAAIIVSGLVWLLPLKKSEHVRLSVSS